MIGADKLHCRGITGRGVTIAVLDTGLWRDTFQFYGNRILATVDVTYGGRGPVTGDPYGHGTHVTSIAASGAQALNGAYQGIAPQANLVVVRAFDGTGAGRYVDVIAGLNWIVANRTKHKIRVLNLSFGAAPQSYYWDDPLNQAVMAAWRAGHRRGRVGRQRRPGPDDRQRARQRAVRDHRRRADGQQHAVQLRRRQARVVLFDGPDVRGLRQARARLAGRPHQGVDVEQQLPRVPRPVARCRPTQQLFTMSGTSQAAAVTSGVVALMLQDEPSLTPDAVKCRLIAAARPAVKTNGRLAYSVFQQGAGLVNARDAVNSSATDCANRGLDIDADLAGTKHFGGPANEDANGNYYVMDMGGTTWGDPLDSDGYTWSRGYPWGEGYAWSDGLHLEPRLHLEPGLYLEPRLHLVARLHLEPRLHVEPQPVVVERAAAAGCR